MSVKWGCVDAVLLMDSQRCVRVCTVYVCTPVLSVPLYSLCRSRVGELETQRAHLHSQLESQRKEAVMRELELFKKQQKKPGILKRGIQKIKGRMSVCAMIQIPNR